MIKFYKTLSGSPMAIDGNYIAYWTGRINRKNIYEVTTIKKFNKEYGNINDIRKIEYLDITQTYKRELINILNSKIKRS